MKKKLAIITTHPIQYNAPLFSLLTARAEVEAKVFYTAVRSNDIVYDPGFGIERKWDIPLLENYEYEFVSIKKKAKWNQYLGCRRLISYIKKWQADAILVIGWNFSGHSCVMYYFKGRIPVLFRGDSTTLDNKGVLRETFRYIFLKWLYKHIDKALYVGSANKAYYLQYGIKETQLVFAPHAIDNDRFKCVKDYHIQYIQSTRLRLGIKESDTTIVFCGKLQPKKDPFILMKAVAELNILDLHLIIIGNGELEAEVKSYIQHIDRIHFLPFHNQSLMPAVYRLGEIFCLPSIGPGETWGLSVNEAMACKRTVLVSDKCGCAADLVRPSINGYIFEAGNLFDLKEKIILLMNKKFNLPAMGTSSSELIDSWNFQKIACAIEQTLG